MQNSIKIINFLIASSFVKVCNHLIFVKNKRFGNKEWSGTKISSIFRSS